MTTVPMEQQDRHELFKAQTERERHGIPETEDGTRLGAFSTSSSIGSVSFGKIAETGWGDASFRRVPQNYPAVPLRAALKMDQWTDWSRGSCPASRTQSSEWYLCLFVSHPWLQRTHVDRIGNGKLILLPEVKEMVQFVGHHVCQAIVCEARHKVYESAPQSMSRLFKRFNAFVRHSVSALVEEGASDERILDDLLDNVCVWIDYEVVPQKPHSRDCGVCAQRRRLMLSSISSIARAALTILVGCDEEEGAKRGWILHETTISLTSDTVFIWDRSAQDIKPLNLVPHLFRLLDGSAKFTNKHDGHSLRVMQFAMLCLEPNCWFRHAELLFGAANIEHGKKPTARQWRKAMQHDVHYRLRHEDPFQQCVAEKDTRVMCRLEIEKLLQRGITYTPDFSEIMQIERDSGLKMFPKRFSADIKKACELREHLLNTCVGAISSLLRADGDVKEEFRAACETLAEMARVMPQWRLFEGKVIVHYTDKYIRDEWLQVGDNM